MKIDGDKIIFDTGKVKTANCGVIGIGSHHSVSDGWDGSFFEPMQDWEDLEDYDGLTVDEQRELADYMIARWIKFKVEAR